MPKKARKAKHTPIHLADLKPWDRNPRDIDAKAAFGLRESMTRFGDLSGIVYNTRLKALVCGHQRTSQATALCNGENPAVEMTGDGRGVLKVGDKQFADIPRLALNLPGQPNYKNKLTSTYHSQRYDEYHCCDFVHINLQFLTRFNLPWLVPVLAPILVGVMRLPSNLTSHD